MSPRWTTIHWLQTRDCLMSHLSFCLSRIWGLSSPSGLWASPWPAATCPHRTVGPSVTGKWTGKGQSQVPPENACCVLWGCRARQDELPLNHCLPSCIRWWTMAKVQCPCGHGSGDSDLEVLHVSPYKATCKASTVPGRLLPSRDSLSGN